MRILTFLGLVMLNSVLIFSLPIKAQEIQTDKNCNATVANALENITNGRTLEVSTKISDISKEYPDHPIGRSFNYLFLMEGQSTSAILQSPKFMKIIAQRVIKSCASVASVSFAENHTGCAYTVGVLLSGKVDYFQIFDSGTGKKLKWGQEFCD